MGRTARLLAACLALLLASCGDDAAAPSTTAATTTAAPTTTTAATSTTTADATTTTEAPAGFVPGDLAEAVLQDGDPWVVPVTGAAFLELTLDSIWPADRFPEERLVYQDAGFQAGAFASFAEDEALVLTGAHLFADAGGAQAAFDLIEASFNDLELVAEITGLAPGSLNLALPLARLEYGDRAAGMILSGPEFQVVGVIWVTGNLLQFVRVGMAVGDEDRTAAVLDIAQAMADRMA